MGNNDLIGLNIVEGFFHNNTPLNDRSLWGVKRVYGGEDPNGVFDSDLFYRCFL